jgi:hypothetical protein
MIAPGAVSAYRAAAVRLREVAEWNRFDARFQDGENTDRPGRLVPLVDASIVKFFMDPDNEVHLIDSFANLQFKQVTEGGASDAEASRLSTFARITAEFMFLHTPVTIGREQKQLWREPPLLAPAHAQETAAMLRSIEGKVARIYDEVRDKTEAEIRHADGSGAMASVDALSEAVRPGEPRPDEFQHLVDGLSKAFDQMFKPRRRTDFREVNARKALEIARALEEAVRWWRLMKQAKLRPLLSHPLCNAEILDPPSDKVRRLATALAAQKRAGAWARGEPSARVMQRALHDATVVVQATLMNEAARKTDGGTGEELRFILITADEGLHRVYAEQFWQGVDPDPKDYVLRRPLQYIPIMNARDIPNGYGAYELFQRFLSVLTSVTDFVTQRTCGWFALEHDWRGQQRPPGMRPTALEMAAFERLTELWQQATTATNALCAGLAVHDFGITHLTDRLDRLAGDAQVLTPLIDLHEQIYRSIDGIQLPLIAQEMLVEAVGALRRQAKGSGVAGVRMPLLIRERFSEATGDRRIEDFVAGLAHGTVASSHKRLLEAMKGWARHKVLFFAGSVAAVANNFERAMRHLSLAEESGRSDLTADQAPDAPVSDAIARELAEISYLRCVVNRLSMRDGSGFNHTRERLKALRRAAPRGSFERARAMSEMGSLLLMRYFNVQFDIETGAAPGTTTTMVERAKPSLEDALQLVQQLLKRQDQDPALMGELVSQVHTNRICWYVINSGFFDRRSTPFPDAVRDSLYALEEAAGERLESDHIIGLWGQVGSWLTAPPTRRGDMALEVAKFCRSRLQALEAMGADYQAPVDAKVFAFVAERASAET